MTAGSSQPRHVLMTADTVGGVWTYAMELCAQLAARGISVSLATMGERVKPHQWEQASAIPNLNIYESTFALEWMDQPWGDVEAAGKWLLDLQRRTGADLVHLNGYVHGALPWAVPVVVVAHSCVLSWWRAVKKENAPDRYHLYRHLVTCGIREADALVAPSAWMLDQIRLHYKPLNGGSVIYNARDGFAPGDKEPLIFACGRIWDEAKNLGSLCAIAPLLKWPVAIAGDVVHPNGSKVALSRVELLGSVDQREIASWLQRASIYAFPAYYEPFGLSVLEAALSGCALVLSRIGSLQEIWGDAAVYVSPDDLDGLKRAINRLIDNPAERNRLAIRAVERAREFTSHRMAQQYLRVYSTARRHFEQTATDRTLTLEKSCA